MTTPTQLMNVVEFIARALADENVRYVFAGSVSSLIQGCEIMPGDIDLLVSEAEDIRKIVRIFEEFLNEDDNLNTVNAPMEDWFSSVSAPIRTFADFAEHQWTFARLHMYGIKVEAACIQPLEDMEYIHGSGFWENGPLVWEYIISVPYKDVLLPVIPLEIQLETNMNRNIVDRINKIVSVFQAAGYDEQLVSYALNENNRSRLKKILAKGSYILREDELNL